MICSQYSTIELESLERAYWLDFFEKPVECTEVSIICLEGPPYPDELLAAVRKVASSDPAAIALIVPRYFSVDDLSELRSGLRAVPRLLVGFNSARPFREGYKVRPSDQPHKDFEGWTDLSLPKVGNRAYFWIPDGEQAFARRAARIYIERNNLPSSPLIESGYPVGINFRHKILSYTIPANDRHIPSEFPLRNKVVVIGEAGNMYPTIGSPMPQIDIQAQCIATIIKGDGYLDRTHKRPVLIPLVVGVISTILFSLLGTGPRLLLWLVLSVAGFGVVEYQLAVQHRFVCWAPTYLLIQLGFLVGTLINLETRIVERNRLFARAMQEKGEEERKRIARDLHDEVLPGLARIGRMIDKRDDGDGDRPVEGGNAEKAAGSNGGSTNNASMRTNIESISDEMRRIITDLHPAVLDTLGLIPALEHLSYKLSNEIGCTITVKNETGQEDVNLPSFSKLSIYRMVQEALNNVEKHASATQVIIIVSLNSGILTVTVCDDGKGLGDRKNQREKPESLGMLSMKQRAEVVGGKVSWGKPRRFSSGTEIRITIPVPRGEESKHESRDSG